MPIKQHTTYYEDFTIKTYAESMDDIRIVYREYNRQGFITYDESSNGDWTKWEYDNHGQLTHKTDNQGRWFKMSNYPPIPIKNGLGIEEIFRARYSFKTWDGEESYYDEYDRLIRTNKKYGINNHHSIITYDDDLHFMTRTYYRIDGVIEETIKSGSSLPNHYQEIKEFYKSYGGREKIIYELQKMQGDDIISGLPLSTSNSI